MLQDVSLFAAFAAGVLSFISPCVLPLIPVSISSISVLPLDEMHRNTPAAVWRQHVLIASLAFVLGFSVVFVAAGASASAIGRFLLEQAPIIKRIAGAILIVLGLHMMGVFRIRLLESEKRIHTQRKPAGPIG